MNLLLKVVQVNKRIILSDGIDFIMVLQKQSINPQNLEIPPMNFICVFHNCLIIKSKKTALELKLSYESFNTVMQDYSTFTMTSKHRLLHDTISADEKEILHRRNIELKARKDMTKMNTVDLNDILFSSMK